MNYEELLQAIPDIGITLQNLMAVLSDRNKAMITPARRAGVINIDATVLGGFVTKVGV